MPREIRWGDQLFIIENVPMGVCIQCGEKVIKPKDTIKDVVFYHPQSSPESPDGYSGRIGIYEVLNVTETIKEMIVKCSTSDKIQDQAQKEGMKTMVEDGFVKAARGITTIEEVLRVIMD